MGLYRSDYCRFAHPGSKPVIEGKFHMIEYRSVLYRYPDGRREIYIQLKNVVGGWSTVFVGTALQAIKYCETHEIKCETSVHRFHPASPEGAEHMQQPEGWEVSQ